MTFYLCVWYPRTAHAQRISLLYSAVTLAGAFGGLLAFAIVKMNGYEYFVLVIIRGLIFVVSGLAASTDGLGLYSFLLSLSSL